MSTAVTIRFHLNGTQVEVTGPPEMPVLFALRDHLGAKGARLGCGEGNCGACTITRNGVALTSCDLPLEAIDGAEIGTIEGLLAQDHPLVEAILHHQAGQCGYCLPGIMTRAARLIDDGKSVDDIRTALDANLCRCGAQGRIMAAIADVVAGRDAP